MNGDGFTVAVHYKASVREASQLVDRIKARGGDAFAGLLEFVGGIAIVLGLFTRPVAFVLSGETAFAYFIAHAPQSFFPGINGGEAAILFCFVFLYLAAAGAGPWSLDAARRQ